MLFQINPRQALVLWKLLITEEKPNMGSVAPEDREGLLDAELIELKDRKTLKEQGLIDPDLKGHTQHILLTDKAWDWAVENFDVELSKSSAAAAVLERLLTKLEHHLKSHGIALAELLVPKGNNEDGLEDSTSATLTKENALAEEIKQAYSKISDGSGVGVLLATLRQYLKNFSREEIDNMLLQMQRDSKLALIRIDDPQAITSEDKDAAIDIGGENRHIVYLED